MRRPEGRLYGFLNAARASLGGHLAAPSQVFMALDQFKMVPFEPRSFARDGLKR